MMQQHGCRCPSQNLSVTLPSSSRSVVVRSCGARAIRLTRFPDAKGLSDAKFRIAVATFGCTTTWMVARIPIARKDSANLWDYHYPKAALRFWRSWYRSWYRRAIASRIPALVRFARRLKLYLPGILAHCRWHLHTSVLEGVNNKIKVLKRMAYGYRDDAYFFLKIRAAFPGIP